MKGTLTLFTVLLAAFVAVGCSDRKAPTGLSPGTPAGSATLSKGGPPSESGPIVMRTTEMTALGYPDVRAGLSVLLGGDAVKYCLTGEGTFVPVDVQRVDVPNAPNRLIELVKGTHIKTTVWPFATFDCGLFLSMDPIAEGYSDVVSTDNDVVAYLPHDNANVNAFGFSARGNLEGPDGTHYLFRGHSRAVWDGQDPSTLRYENKIVLVPRRRE